MSLEVWRLPSQPGLSRDERLLTGVAYEKCALNMCNSLYVSYKRVCLVPWPLMALSKRQVITQGIKLRGIGSHLIFTIQPPSASSPDFTFGSMCLNGEEYRLCPRASQPHFTQWVYLLYPQAFRVAVGREGGEPYVLKSRAAFTRGPVDSTLVWTLTVDHVVADCTPSGVASEPREFTLVFHRKRVMDRVGLGLSRI